MSHAVTYSATLVGLSDRVVRIEAEVSAGLPEFRLTGLPMATTGSTRDRVRAAILNSGHAWPDRRITVAVSLSEVPSYGCMLDVAIAMAILAAAGVIPAASIAHTAFVGELGLDGGLRHVRGLPSAIEALAAAGFRAIAVPVASIEHPGQRPVISATCLTDLIEQLARDTGPAEPGSPSSRTNAYHVDLADLPGDQAGKRALEISAAGGHHLLLHGHPAPAALADCLPDLLPPLDAADHSEVGEIYALANLPRRNRRRPLCTPHYSNTAATIFGLRSHGRIHPGAVSLAHAGVLFLDDAPAYALSILDGLRLPLDTGEVILADSDGIVHLPARFQLVLAASACSCGRENCRCRPAHRHRHLNRLTALRSRIAITTTAQPDDPNAAPGATTATVAARVAEARARAAYRLAGTPHRANGDIPALDLRTAHRLDPEALDPLDLPLRSGKITFAAMTQILRVAWTLADLRAAARPSKDDTHHALRLWQGAPL
ncbi:ATP-binding protein [Nonomuraea sp. FMUSA5-5]|uniref:ATP-binding protein n=1 Tax=Nonomuraea composti TaxID=2720023 RepID=A0ABX1B521_9ACTN|nr:ATP-binding protein [Nonomuraea sp. FMUSA5-5]NJP91612.1 ATP-binding protein [Nonomuraea sp. FMUSA5-5]